ncbi:hypothetical protein F5884DRAFT_85627 [Xylogone sp. PMI_703]|nr:hypothetical protein F5884DRAFT_85627 [Xylogone sp. PMI_703]
MEDDERRIELDCIAAIFPELTFDPENPFAASLSLPINPQNPIAVKFVADNNGVQADGAAPPPQQDANARNQVERNGPGAEEIENLSYLPDLQVHIILPDGYPSNVPAKFELSTSPAWLPEERLSELESNALQMWEETDHDQMVFGYIDSLQQAAENAFGYGEDGQVLQLPRELRIGLLDFNIQAKQTAFAKETFECGVCLDPKKGSVCHRMIDCGHVFCVQCLQDFYNNAIKEGDLVSVRCLTPNCAKKRSEEWKASDKTGRKPKTQLSPNELLQIPLEQEMVARYVKLKHKADLESDKNTVYCPRKWCQGAARSKKHRKPDGLEIDDGSDEEEEPAKTGKDYKSGEELLCICEDCSYAFCSRCFQGWHGEFTLCIPRRDNGELTEEDKASLEYLRLHTTPCPTCAAPAQKTHGCNHMICFKCNSHFCYLCSAWLQPENPYIHFNKINTGCYMRLWELEGGDGDDVGIGYGGAGDRGHVREEPQQEIDLGDDMIVGDRLAEGDLHDDAAINDIQEQRPDAVNNAQAGPPQPLQREGPLVLRLNVPAQAAGLNGVPHVPDPPVPAGRNRAPRGQRQAHNANNVGGRRGGAAPVVQAAPARAARGAAGRQQRNAAARPVGAADQAAQDAMHQAWVQRFVELALNDEEDLIEWDSDDEENPGAWEIPVR